MANSLYDKAKKNFLEGKINWLEDDIRVALLDTNIYSVNISTHEYLSDVAPSSIVATSGTLGSKTTTAGVADASDVTFTTGIISDVQAILIYQNSGTSTTSRLIAYIDTADILPIASTSSPVSILWDEGSNKVFSL